MKRMKDRSKMHLLYYNSLNVMLFMESLHVFVPVPWLMSGILSVNVTSMDIQKMCLQGSSQKISFTFVSVNNLTSPFNF